MQTNKPKTEGLFPPRLPVYVLVDCTQAEGCPSREHLQKTLTKLLAVIFERNNNSGGLSLPVWFSVIGFGHGVFQVYPMSQASASGSAEKTAAFVGEIPTAEAGEGDQLCKALVYLRKRIDSGEVANSEEYQGDYDACPLVFILTRHVPTDNERVARIRASISAEATDDWPVRLVLVSLIAETHDPASFEAAWSAYGRVIDRQGIAEENERLRTQALADIESCYVSLAEPDQQDIVVAAWLDLALRSLKKVRKRCQSLPVRCLAPLPSGGEDCISSDGKWRYPWVLNTGGPSGIKLPPLRVKAPEGAEYEWELRCGEDAPVTGKGQFERKTEEQSVPLPQIRDTLAYGDRITGKVSLRQGAEKFADVPVFGWVGRRIKHESSEEHVIDSRKLKRRGKKHVWLTVGLASVILAILAVFIDNKEEPGNPPDDNPALRHALPYIVSIEPSQHSFGTIKYEPERYGASIKLTGLKLCAVRPSGHAKASLVLSIKTILRDIDRNVRLKILRDKLILKEDVNKAALEFQATIDIQQGQSFPLEGQMFITSPNKNVSVRPSEIILSGQVEPR